MAKKKTDDIFHDLAAALDGEVLADADTAKYFIDTGSLAINYSCSGRFINGGIPGGRITEIYGPSASSKSLIGSNLIHGCQKIGGVPVLLDCENASNKEFIQKASHCDLNRVAKFRPRTLEQNFKKICKTIEFVKARKGADTPIVVVWDSISVCPCERELREVDLPEDATEADWKRIVKAHEQPGERAKVCSRELRKLNAVMEGSNASVIILNQTRQKIGVLYGNPETTGGGGTSLEFYASLRMRPQAAKKIEKKLAGRLKKIIGVNIRLRNIKNRTYRPFVEVDNIPLYFERGFNPLGGLLGALLDAERIVAAGPGRFAVKEPWAGGEEVTFRSSLERNDLPLDVLFKCPSLIDAQSAEEIREYLEPSKEAIEFNLEGEDIVQTEVRDEQEEADIDRELEQG